MVALNSTSKALTLGGSGHINILTNGKHFNRKLITSLQLSQLFRINAEFGKTTASLNTSLTEMTRLGSIDSVSLLYTERQLNSIVAISFYGLDLRDAISRHVQHSHRDGCTIFSKNAGHADFATDKT